MLVDTLQRPVDSLIQAAPSSLATDLGANAFYPSVPKDGALSQPWGCDPFFAAENQDSFAVFGEPFAAPCPIYGEPSYPGADSEEQRTASSTLSTILEEWKTSVTSEVDDGTELCIIYVTE